MGKLLEKIDADLAAWIAKQRVFFVATAKGSRNHAFAKTAAEHQKNVEKYVQSEP